MTKKEQLKQTNKKQYSSPELNVDTVIMEHSIAAQSATVNITGDAGINQPAITDWTDKGTIGDGISEF
ncbi:hypothetical protein [Elizabethkingia meningoseptica]|uniref:hypothetical protein n=1 Tax=Elizabethkingia meningoseptica TaxID=238 RepID=UPI002DD62623|nr:hypothetical protein [Elizabethkingia meningoseptica]MEC4712111.1 hypothetical protein [Elizabethkingia meningoseptica]